ncbi:MAG: hypothetical protein V3S69_03845 [Dehalococcoidales bacterium]
MPNLMEKKKAFLKRGHRYLSHVMDNTSRRAVVEADTLKKALDSNPFKRELDRKKWAQLTCLKWGFAHDDYPLMIKTLASLK